MCLCGTSKVLAVCTGIRHLYCARACATWWVNSPCKVNTLQKLHQTLPCQCNLRLASQNCFLAMLATSHNPYLCGCILHPPGCLSPKQNWPQYSYILPNSSTRGRTLVISVLTFPIGWLLAFSSCWPLAIPSISSGDICTLS